MNRRIIALLLTLFALLPLSAQDILRFAKIARLTILTSITRGDMHKKKKYNGEN